VIFTEKLVAALYIL